MPVSRRTALKTLGAAGGLSIGAGTVFATGEHEDDERPVDEEEPTEDEAEPTDDELDVVSSAVRVAHFSPDAPDVDILVDGDQVLADVTYGDISPYLELEPGTYTVTIAAADDPETVAFEGEVEIDEAFYTVAAIGELEAETFRPEVLTDAEPLPEDIGADSAAVRVAHFSPDAPAVDVYADDEPLVEDVSFEDVSEYLAVPAGEYVLSIRPAGEEDEVASFDVALEAETPYTGYAIGYLEPPEDVTDRDFTVELAVDGPAASADEPENDDEVPDDENDAPEDDAPKDEDDAPKDEDDAPKDEDDEKDADGKENGKDVDENGKEAPDEKDDAKDVDDKDVAEEKEPADGKNGVDEKEAADGKDAADGKNAANGKDTGNGKGNGAANGKDAADGKKATPDNQC